MYTIARPLLSEKTYNNAITSFQEKLREFVRHKSDASYDQSLLHGVLSILVILENVLESKTLARELLSGPASAGIATDVFEAVYVTPMEDQNHLKMIIHAASTVWRMIALSAADTELSVTTRDPHMHKSNLWRSTAAGDEDYRALLISPVLSHVKKTITDVSRSDR